MSRGSTQRGRRRTRGGNYVFGDDCFFGNTIDVMGGCCGQTFRSRLQTDVRSCSWGPPNVSGSPGTGSFDVTPFTGSIHHSFHNLSESRESSGSLPPRAASYRTRTRIQQTLLPDATKVSATYPRRLNLPATVRFLRWSHPIELPTTAVCARGRRNRRSNVETRKFVANWI